MGHQVRLPRGKSRPGARGTRKPRAHNPVPGRVFTDAFQVFGERQRREFDSSPWPMRIFEHGSFRFLAVNDAAVKLYGYTREEFLAMTAKDTRHPEELDDFLTTLTEPAGYFRHLGSRRHVKKNGEIIVVEAVTQDILFNGRKARLSMNIDVTERNKAEDEVRRQKNLFAAVIDNLPVGVFIRDAKTQRYVMRNRFSENMFGYPVDTSAGKTAYDVFPKEQADLTVATDRQALESGRMVDIPELKMLGRAGDTRIQHVRKVPVFDQDGKPWLLVGIADDITDRKRAEDALRESEERFRQLAENIRQVFWISTLAGDHINYISPGYEEIWGRSRESLYRNPRSWMEPIHPEDLPVVWRGQEKIARGEHTEVDYRIIRPDGTMRWINDRSYSMKRSDGTQLVCGIAEDITDLKRAEEARLIHAIHQRDALVREVHHRIKNHLQGIAGLLRDKIGGNPAAALTIEAAIAQLQSVAVVYGLQSTSTKGEIHVRQVLEAICSSAQSLTGGRIACRFAAGTEGALRLAEAEAVPIAVALNELVFNALKHGTAPGGVRSIEVELVEKDGSAEVRIVNRGKLSTGFDYARGAGTGTGLDLVRTLLGTAGSELSFDDRDARVEVTLSLWPPLLATARAPVVA